MTQPTTTMLAAANEAVRLERRLELADLPSGWAAVLGLLLLVGLCWSIVWLYRRELRGAAHPRARVILAVVRCLVICVLAVIWMEPVLATYVHRIIPSYTLVLVDTSASMDLRDRYDGDAKQAEFLATLGLATKEPVRRIDVARTLLTHENNRLLSDLAERNRVKLYTFGDVPRLLVTLSSVKEDGATEVGPSERRRDADGRTTAQADQAVDARSLVLPELRPTDKVTNPARALYHAVDGIGDAPLAGVVILSDGGFNEGDTVAQMAGFARERDLPLHVVGMGTPVPPRNVTITRVVAPQSVFAQDPYAITVHLETVGLPGEQVTVELYERGAEHGPPRLVEQRVTTIDARGDVAAVTFEQQRGDVGRVRYRVHVPVGESEAVAEDNTRVLTVNVIDNQMRVLLVAGSPSWEYRYVSRLLQRDATFNLSCWLQSADIDAVRDGNTIIDHLPETAEELLEYDAIVLMDPDPAQFTFQWALLTEKLVSEYGGGLLLTAARPFTPALMRSVPLAPLRNMLPVTADPEADLVLNAIGHYQLRGHPIDIPPAALAHPVLQQAGDATEAQRRWREIAGVYWHYPVLRPKAAAQVLMRHGDPKMTNAYGRHVLCATQFVGAGRTAFLAFDSTWRWRRAGEEAFNRFWVQMLRYLVEGKLLGGKQQATMTVEQDTCELGDDVTVRARLYNAALNPLRLESVSGRYRIGEDTRDFTLQREPDKPGWYAGRFTPHRPGTCEITVGPGIDQGATATHEVQVTRPNREIADPRMDQVTLRALAGQSAAGRYYELTEVSALPDRLIDRHEATVVRTRPRLLWDRWWTLIILVGLVSLEWSVRKWAHLL